LKPVAQALGPEWVSLQQFSGNVEAKNRDSTMSPSAKRFCHPLPVLKLTGQENAKTDWPLAKKPVIWTASTLLFFGYFRMEELFSPEPSAFNKGWK
jgi:hypothetical protein